MSRCLPFPPPNYVKNGFGGEKLLQQLELRRKKAEYAKKKKKEEKRKEEKEKKKRDKKRSHDHKDDNDDKKKKKKNTEEGEKEHNVCPSIDSDSVEEENEINETTSKEYKKLIENWVPLPLQIDFENEEWLAKNNEIETKHVSSSSSTADIKQGIQPRAYYLPHADIYALPYVLPF